MVGHDMTSTDTVLWSRVLDRRRGPNPPALIVIDPRRTHTAEEADLHLVPRIGTNVALLNGIINLLIESERIDGRFIDERTVGLLDLQSNVSRFPPARVTAITEISESDLPRAAEMIGEARTLVSTCLQPNEMTSLTAPTIPATDELSFPLLDVSAMVRPLLNPSTPEAAQHLLGAFCY